MTTPHAADLDHFIEQIKAVCEPRVYLDIGAGDGFDCGIVADYWPECRCIAIEPYEAWMTSPRVQRSRAVIGAENGGRTFHVKKTPGIHSLYDRLCVDTEFIEQRFVMTLDEFCKANGIEFIDAAKIDVEGAAWDVLAGAGPILQTVKVLHVETEWLPLFDGQHMQGDVFSLLSVSGMEKIWEHRVEELGQGDSIWVRR